MEYYHMQYIKQIYRQTDSLQLVQAFFKKISNISF